MNEFVINSINNHTSAKRTGGSLAFRMVEAFSNSGAIFLQ